LAKSGKSTLINALVGSELMPMNNVPETARICKVVHDPGAKEPYLVEPGGAAAGASTGSPLGGAAAAAENVTARGEEEVRARLQALNSAVRAHEASRTSSTLLPAASTPLRAHPLSPSTSLQSQAGSAGAPGSGLAPAPSMSLAGGGSGADRLLVIRAPIAALREYGDSQAGGNGAGGQHVRLQLLDTPGPNEAGEEQLRFVVERLLDGVDAALYLLDYTKLKTSDEAAMFERLKAVNPALVRRLSQRLFFVVNKVDAAQSCEGQDADTTREYVADLVTRQIGCEGFQLMPHQVVLVSARNGLLSRLVLSGKAGPEARRRFAQLAFGRFADPDAMPQDMMQRAAAALLADSGLLDLEAQVLGWLGAHAAGVKALAVVDDLGRLLGELRNVAASCAAALRTTADALQARVAELRAQLATTLDAFDAAKRDADAIAVEVAREVTAHLQTLRGKLLGHIVSVLDTSNTCDHTWAEVGATRPHGRGSAALAVHQGRWGRVRERFLSIFTTLRGRGLWGPPLATNVHAPCGRRRSSGSGRVSGSGDSASSASAYYSSFDSERPEEGPGSGGVSEADVEAAVMAAAGGAVARSRSKGELVALLAALHDDLMAQVHAEVAEFWGVLEAVAAARHAELLTALNAHLGRLARQVEDSVSHSLGGVALAPVRLRLERPSAQAFHTDLDALIAKGVVETRERHIRVGQKAVEERVLRRGGICRWGEYWESVPRMRTVVEAYTLTVYELAPAEITAHFVGVVDAAIDATQASLSSYVAAFVGEQLGAARAQLEAYSGSYLGAMQAALDAGSRGAEHRLAALEQVCTFMSRVDGLLSDLGALGVAAEARVPRPRDLIAYDELEELEGGHEEEQQEGQEPAPPSQADLIDLSGDGEQVVARQGEGEGEGDALQQQEEEQQLGQEATAAEAEAAVLTSPFAALAAEVVGAGSVHSAASDMSSSSLAGAAGAPSEAAAGGQEEVQVAAGVEAAGARSVALVQSAPEAAAVEGAVQQVDAPAPPAEAARTPAGAAHERAPATAGAAAAPARAPPGSPTDSVGAASASSSVANRLLSAPLDASGLAGGAASMHSEAAGQEAAVGTDAGGGGSAHAPSLQLSSGPFDYSSGFFRAMSTSQVLGAGDEGAVAAAGGGAANVSGHASDGASDEWALVERDSEGEGEQEGEGEGPPAEPALEAAAE